MALTPQEELDKMLKITSSVLPSIEELDRHEYSNEQALKDLEESVEILKPFASPDIYRCYADSVLSSRNSSYGNHSWNLLGMKFLYGQLFAKYLRFVECRSFDSLVDTFGYCVLAMTYVRNHMQDKTEYDDYISYFTKEHNLNNFLSQLDGFPISKQMGVYQLFKDNMVRIWNSVLSEFKGVIEFIICLVLFMSVEYVNPSVKLGEHF